MNDCFGDFPDELAKHFLFFFVLKSENQAPFHSLALNTNVCEMFPCQHSAVEALPFTSKISVAGCLDKGTTNTRS